MKPHLHIEIERFDDRVFVRFFFNKLSAGVLMFAPLEWNMFAQVLAQVFEITIDTIDHNKERIEQ